MVVITYFRRYQLLRVRAEAQLLVGPQTRPGGVDLLELSVAPAGFLFLNQKRFDGVILQNKMVACCTNVVVAKKFISDGLPTRQRSYSFITLKYASRFSP